MRSFSEYLVYRAPLRNCLFHVQVTQISTSRYSLKLFHRCYSNILYKNEKYPIKGVHLLKILENYLWGGWFVMKLPTYKFTKKNSLTSPPSWILPSFSKSTWRLLLPKRLSTCASKTSLRKNKRKVVLLVIYLFNYDSSKSTSFMLNLAFAFVLSTIFVK